MAEMTAAQLLMGGPPAAPVAGTPVAAQDSPIPDGAVQTQDLRAAGFSDEEIGQWASEKRDELKSAGFSDAEVDAWFGGDRVVPESKGLVDRLTAGADRVFTAMWQGAKEGYGDRPLGLPADMAHGLGEMGVILDQNTGQGGPLRFLNEAMIRPVAAGVDFVIRTGSAGVLGAARATGQAAKEAGMDEAQANRLTRDIPMLAESIGITSGVPLARLRRAPTGEIRVEQIGRMPRPDDFDTATTVLTGGRADPVVRQKLIDLWEQKGIHPNEAVLDAADDVTLAQDLLSSNVSVGPGKSPVSGTTPPLPRPARSAAQETVLSKVDVGRKDPKDPLTLDRLYTMAFDDLHPIRRATIEMTGKKRLPTAQDPYQIARLTRGVFGKADQFLEYSTYDFHTFKNNGPGLRKILEPVANDLDGLRAYAVSRRSVELDERNIATGIDLDAAREVVKGGEKYEPVMRGLVDYQNRLVAYLKDAGVLSDDAYAAMLEANKQYVPFFRVMDDVTPAGASGTRGVIRDPIRGIKGSERDIVDPIESVIKNTYMYMALAERNAAAVKFIEMAEASGRLPDFAKPIPTPVRAVTVREPEMKAFLEANGIPNMPEDVLTVLRSTRVPVAADEIALFRNGKREVYKVEPEIAEAFRGADAGTANLLLKILSVPAKLLRAGSVLTPEFIARNLIRDQSSAFVLSKGGYIPAVDFVRGALSISRRDEHFQNWLKSGGANAALVSIDRQYVQSKLTGLDTEAGLVSRGWNVVKSPVEALRIVSELAENATRVGEYRRVARGRTDKASIQEAGFASREVTLDFARIGAKTRAVNMLSAFFNAQVQGLDRTVRAFGERPLATSAKVGASITAPSIALWVVNHGDPRYEELPDWQKNLFWIVTTDSWRRATDEEVSTRPEHLLRTAENGTVEYNEGVIWRIPKPFELGVIFGSLPERILDAYFGENPDALDGFANAVLEALVPNPTPTVATPIIEQFANRSTFTGAPIIPAGIENLLPEYQYNTYTTEAAKALGKLLGAFPGVKKAAVGDEGMAGAVARSLTTPVLVENYIRAWTGGLGVYALKIADTALRKSGVLPDPVAPEATLADIPVIKAFVVRYPSATTESIQKFYDRYFEKKKVYDTIQAKAAEGDVEAVEREMAFDPGALGQLTAVREVLAEHSQLIRMVHKDPEMSASDKRQLIDTLYFRMIELAEAGNDALDEVEKAAKEPTP